MRSLSLPLTAQTKEAAASIIQTLFEKGREMKNRRSRREAGGQDEKVSRENCFHVIKKNVFFIEADNS